MKVQVRFCPSGAMTFDEDRTFSRIPTVGEAILRGEDEDRFVVVEVDWLTNGEAFLIAHSADRPRARRAMGMDA